MENASKALLIAGAILVVILLISVAIYFMDSAMKPTKEGMKQMSSMEITIFNQQFSQFEGKNITGSNIKALIEKVNANNRGLDSANSKFVSIVGNGIVTTTTPYAVTESWSRSDTYTVVVEDTKPAEKDGLIDQITITKNT